MRVLLIQPPLCDFYQTSIRTQPIGLAYLAASLRSYGHEVEILDCHTTRKKPIPIPAELSYLKDFYPFYDKSPFKLYSGYYHFGMEWEEIRQKIKDSKAEIFGISSSFTPYHGEALEIARIIKEWDRKRIVVMGGAHSSCDPESVLKNPVVDYVVLGEGEIRFPMLLEAIDQGKAERIGTMDGTGYCLGDEIHILPLQSFIQDLDLVPFPARELLDLDRYRIEKKRSTMIITSRGCPHRCSYCSAHLVMGASFRIRSPENILQEMKECHQRYGIEVFDIEDDNFSFDKNRTRQLLNLIIETFGETFGETSGEGGLRLSAMNGISFASLDRELLGLMKKAGFQTVNLSFVSKDPSVKETMKRPWPALSFEQILEESQRVGLSVIVYAIFGMPGQKIEEMGDTLAYLTEKRVLIGPSIYYPTPGTPLFQRCKEEGALPFHLSQWRSSALPIETKDFNRLDLLTLFRLARVINFIKGKMDKKEIEEGITWKELYLVLKDKVKVRKEGYPWIDLLLLLFEERAFFSLRKILEGVSLSKEKSSRRILDYFMDRAWERPILKSQQ